MSHHETPPTPWSPGRYETHEVVKVDVTVCRDRLGRVYSSHSLSESDREIALGWPTGGQEQVGFALLTEAVRREAILSLLILMSNDRTAFERIRALPEDMQRAEFENLGQTVTTNLRRTIDALVVGSLQDALEMMSAGS